MRMRGQARSIDVNMLLYENEMMMGRQVEFMQYVAQQFGNLARGRGVEPMPVKPFTAKRAKTKDLVPSAPRSQDPVVDSPAAGGTRTSPSSGCLRQAPWSASRKSVPGCPVPRPSSTTSNASGRSIVSGSLRPDPPFQSAVPVQPSPMNMALIESDV